MSDADLEGLAAFTAHLTDQEPIDLRTAETEKLIRFIKENWSIVRIDKLIRGLNEDNKS